MGVISSGCSDMSTHAPEIFFFWLTCKSSILWSESTSLGDIEAAVRLVLTDQKNNLTAIYFLGHQSSVVRLSGEGPEEASRWSEGGDFLVAWGATGGAQETGTDTGITAAVIAVGGAAAGAGAALSSTTASVVDLPDVRWSDGGDVFVCRCSTAAISILLWRL